MFQCLLGEDNPVHFLQWWNENPIVLGGDRYSSSPGLEVHYIPHSGDQVFELKIQPIQADKLEFTQQCLARLLESGKHHCVNLKLKHESSVLATATLHVDSDCRWAVGEGEWICLKGHPRHWQLECSVE